MISAKAVCRSRLLTGGRGSWFAIILTIVTSPVNIEKVVFSDKKVPVFFVFLYTYQFCTTKVYHFPIF